jgi:hypothetical protein
LDSVRTWSFEHFGPQNVLFCKNYTNKFPPFDSKVSCTVATYTVITTRRLVPPLIVLFGCVAGNDLTSEIDHVG